MKENKVTITSTAAAAIASLASFITISYYWNSFRHRSRSDSNITTTTAAAAAAATGCDTTSHSTKCIYLDYNATTPIDPRVVEAMLPYLTTHFGNPSSSHIYGLEPKLAIQRARQAILELLYPHGFENTMDKQQQRQDGIIFTGCGTEADNLAIHLALQSWDIKTRRRSRSTDTKPCHVVTTNVEHPAVAQYLDAMEQRGMVQVTRIPVHPEGYVTLEDVKQGIRVGETVLVTIMLANNESGALQPVKEVSEYCKKHGILFHTDAAQAIGKVSVAMDETGIGDCVDMITIVGHKFGAPKGIACLYIRPGCLNGGGDVRLESNDYLLIGGGQEGGKRGGTENVPYIVGLGTAASILMARGTDTNEICWKENSKRMEHLRMRLLQNLVQELGDEVVRPNGPKNSSQRLPNTLSVGFRNVHSGELLERIKMLVACSAGSACHSSGGKVSSVLEAMKVPMEYARGTLRLSVGPNTSEKDVDIATKIIVKEVKNQLGLK
mmetsp:Transcript_913/g.1581  ORF Transcript_913/g.1581 Transcript_913/m.1581 type:complete len:494 (-) Transcript_913:255-1736(-)